MRIFTVEFAFDGHRETAECEETEIASESETMYKLTPHNKVLSDKFGKTTFRQKGGKFLTGEPIDDLSYYSALKEGLENNIYDKKD